ncbi:C-X-C motif chemokine 11-6-like [Neoarius graeffei]|uniref:C-X-C motif chemokine 11-6-like n=1 Tax=Neoarius graeffei TaxID=443677 RepID=UPI00298C33BD|nr:C-X-C motif chemokine 11-6-like [Neoarius graeffei]
MKAAAVFLVFASLLIVHVQGQAKTSVRRCLCQSHGMNRVSLQRIDRIEVYSPSASCENVEIIVVLKNGAGKRCLNPESKFAKNYIKNAMQRRSQLKENSSH